MAAKRPTNRPKVTRKSGTKGSAKTPPKKRKSTKKIIPLPPLCFSDIAKTKESISKLLLMFYEGKIKDKKFRVLMYGVQTHLGALRLDLEVDIEKRITKIEKLLKAKEGLRLVQ